MRSQPTPTHHFPGGAVSLRSTVLSDAEEVGDAVASMVLDRMASSDGAAFLLGCPGGRSADSSYQALARRAAEGADLSRLVVVMMDEYVVPDDNARLHHIDPAMPNSCLGYARRRILGPIEAGCARAGTVAPTAIWLPDPVEPERYDERIEAAGGIDLFLLASGATDGHIAFNQPGTPRDSRTHVTRLGKATRRDNMATFPELTRIDMVPTHGVTVGVDTIASSSREAVMIVCGSHKREAYAWIASSERYEPEWPATIAVECKNPTIVADAAAAGG